MTSKPPYRIPSMAEIAAIPWNGFTVASTFSGCGGSSLGYKMAGFKVAWANEFVPAAASTYAANHVGTILDRRDIRTITPEDVLSAIGLSKGELDLFDGSPPCASFSTAGKREAGWGKVRKYSDTSQRTDDLFLEFARLLDGLQPRAFIAENVAGLVAGKAKGKFLEILGMLKACGYRIACRLVDAQWLGVPQARVRAIFAGARNDLGCEPRFPEPLPYRYAIADAIPWISGGGMVTAGNERHALAGERPLWNAAREPSPTIMATPAKISLVGANEDIASGPSIERFAIGREWRKMAIGTSTKYFSLVKPRFDRSCPTICAASGGASIAGVVHPTEPRKFSIPELRRICGFPDDFILTGSYAQQWERLGRAVPPPMMAAIAAAVRDHVLMRKGPGDAA